MLTAGKDAGVLVRLEGVAGILSEDVMTTLTGVLLTGCWVTTAGTGAGMGC